jgi:penicillin amidase
LTLATAGVVIQVYLQFYPLPKKTEGVSLTEQIVKRWILIIALIVVGVVAVLAVAGYLWYTYTLKRSLPQTSGTMVVRGLKETVEIIRDTYGVPHIYANNEPDLFFAFGYAMAQDRFWQMELYRRLGQGRLSEVLGRDFVAIDRYVRTLSAAGMNEEIPEELAFIFTSFAGGVNAYLETHRERLPVEFKILGYTPDPWSVGDYFPILKVLNWALSSGWKVDLTAAKMLQKVEKQKLREAFPVWPDEAPLIVPQESAALPGLPNRSMEMVSLMGRLVDLPTAAASNSWVVSGKRSATGKPILANDPHLSLTSPSFWWEVHLVCPTLNVSGVAVPGTPGISVGHNRQVAWGVTNVMVDDVDFYIERVNPENRLQYWNNDHWEAMKVVEGIIRVKDEEPVRIEILLTRHGPVVEQIAGSSGRKAISARWSFTEVPQPAKATYLLLKARDVNEVKEALRHWSGPSQNIVFADTRGNIGYWCCATIPIRSNGDGILPMPGWTDEYEWNGYVPFEDCPHVINPKAEFIATANNKVVEEAYPYLISHYWEPMDRITRIRQMLSAKETLSVEDFKTMQGDVYSVLASEMTPKLIQVLEKRLIDREGQRARDILDQWDFMMGKESVGACLFEVTFGKMMENIFRDELGEKLFSEYLKAISFPPRALRKMIRKGSSSWFDDVNTPEIETMEDILAKSLTQMLSELKEALGNDMGKWTWGRIHSLTFEHALGQRKPLDRILSLGPFPLGGSHLTVNMGQYPYEKPYSVNAGVSLRMIVDLSDVDQSLRVLPTGESGHPRSPHYKDQVTLYLGGQYHPDWTDRREVEKHSEAILVLKPKL